MSAFGGRILLALTLIGAVGCAARVRVYDEPHHDYHHWDHREDASFRIYLGERHMAYRDYNQLNASEQNDYWDWRHNHPDR